ncbi:SEL1-like repeat protein [Andreesenia angusta]
MHLHGEGVKRDYTEGLKWLKKAAEQGDLGARKLLLEL